MDRSVSPSPSPTSASKTVKLQKNVNRYTRLAQIQPQFKTNLNIAQRRLQNAYRNERQNNLLSIKRPGLVAERIEQLSPGSSRPESPTRSNSPSGFGQSAGRRTRKTRKCFCRKSHRVQRKSRRYSR